ncbi:permease [Desulforhabdus sp. TSK]|uniref:permease n=1 Tax=Desulforhabdus sp. TSK TaxID=2925014 RepID=UPI001FC8A7D0|nr:permease [Desulforhabdus sp. TSK]GKT07803.1 hypothetical protein DSTSK_11080 [Desulforhabdus sp. TSK]
MKANEEKGCCCAARAELISGEACESEPRSQMMRYLVLSVPALVIWWLIYSSLAPFSKFLTYTLLDLSPESHFGSAVEFFVYDTPKVLMLLTLVVFAVGILRSFFTPERTRKILAGKRESLGTVLAFMMAVIALSLPEAIILRKVLKPTLIATFFGVVGTGILFVGYLFNMLI